MAKILVISRYWDRELDQFLDSIQDLNLDLTLCTDTKSEVDQLQVPVIRPFRNWNLKEFFLFSPYLIQNSYEVIHFFLKSGEKPSAAHMSLIHFFRALQKKVILTQAADVKNSYWSQLTFFSQFNLQVKKDSLMPDAIDPENLTDKIPSELKVFVEKMKPFVLIPDDVLSFYQQAQTLSPHLKSHKKDQQALHFLFLKESVKKTFLENLSYVPNTEFELQYLFSQSQGAVLAFSDLNSFELLKYKNLSYYFKIPLVINPWQKEMVPGLVRQDETGWILERGLMEFLSLLIQNPTLKIDFQNTLKENESQREVDVKTNQISRLYSL